MQSYSAIIVVATVLVGKRWLVGSANIGPMGSLGWFSFLCISLLIISKWANGYSAN